MFSVLTRFLSCFEFIEFYCIVLEPNFREDCPVATSCDCFVTTCDNVVGGVDVVVGLTPRGTTHNWTDLSRMPRAICKGGSSFIMKVT